MSNVLKIRDENGNFIGIPAITGTPGKSAYEQAVEGGYPGTEEEFIQTLATLAGVSAIQLADANDYEEHIEDKENPHKVTAEQAGALAKDGTNVMEAPLRLLNNVKITGNRDHLLSSCLIDATNDSGDVCRLVVEKTHSGESNVFVQSIDNNILFTSKIYGEHNKPTKAYTGNGGSQTVQVGGIGVVAWLVGANGVQGFVSQNGFLGMNSNGQMSNQDSNYLTLENGVLSLKLNGLCNASGIEYTVQVL